MARGSCVCFSPIPHAPQPPSGAAPRFSDSQRVRLRLSRSSGSAVVTDESWREEAGVRKGREESAVRGSTLRAVPPPRRVWEAGGEGRSGGNLSTKEIFVSPLWCLEGGSYPASVGCSFGKEISIFCQDRESLGATCMGLPRGHYVSQILKMGT